jgi:Ca2+-binding EF-hand superfamily protein
MLAGIIYSLRSLVWAALLLLSIMYLVSVCLLQFASEEFTAKAKDPVNGGSLNDEEFKALKDYFGSLAVGQYTLFLSICGGIDWGDAAAPMMALHTALGLLFALYIAFAVLCVLNIITGVFVENSNRLTIQDDEMVLMEQMETRKKWMIEVRELFEAADVSKNGSLSMEEFENVMADVRMQAWFRKIGVQVESYSAQGLFSLLDFDGDGQLDLDEFGMALQSVHGSARAVEVAKVQRDTRTIRKDLRTLSDLLSNMLGTPELPQPLN